MPRIPVAVRPQIRNVDSEGLRQLGGAPGLNWNVDPRLQQGAQQIGDALRGLGNSLGDLFLLKQRADDEDNFNEIKLAVEKSNADLHLTIEHNPNAYDQFGTWHAEREQALQEQVKPLLDKLSSRTREEAEYFLKSNAIKQKTWVTDVSWQADITTKRERFDNRIKYYADTGNLDAAHREVESAKTSGVLSPKELDTYTQLIQERSLYGDAARRIEANDPNVAEDLQKRDEHGNYVNYSGLSEHGREMLIRSAERNQAIVENQQTDQFVADLMQGKIPEEQEIWDRPDLNAGTKNHWVKVLRGVKQEQARAKQEAEQEERRERTRKAREEKERFGQACDKFEFEIMEYPFSADETERLKQYNTLKRQVYEEVLPRDPAAAKRLIVQLDESFKAKAPKAAGNAAQESYKNSYGYQYGRQMLKQLENKFYSRYPGRGESWYSFLTNVYNDDKNLKASNYAMAQLKFDAFMKQNPNATVAEIDQFLNQLQRDTNQAECDKLMEFWGGYRVPNLVNPLSVKPGTVLYGRRFKGGDPSNENNWETAGQPEAGEKK